MKQSQRIETKDHISAKNWTMTGDEGVILTVTKGFVIPYVLLHFIVIF
jgi:hypothetical protein